MMVASHRFARKLAQWFIIYTIIPTNVHAFSIHPLLQLPTHQNYDHRRSHTLTATILYITNQVDDIATASFPSSSPSSTTTLSLDDTIEHNELQVIRDQLEEMRLRKLKIMLQKYQVNDMFQPISWLRNNHIQTIGGYLFRKLATTNSQQKFAYIRHKEPWYTTIQNMIQAVSIDIISKGGTSNKINDTSTFWDERIRINTLDSDFFHVDVKYGKDEHDSTTPLPIVIILHGLQSNSQSPVCIEMATAIQQQFMDQCIIHCINFRGCSGVPNDTIGGYHLGYTNDVILYLQHLYSQYNSNSKSSYPPIYMTGFSLGANVVIKCLGELGNAALQEPYNVRGAAVLCLPFDQVANAPVLAQDGINRYIYTNNLLSSLKNKCTEQYERFYKSNPNIDVSEHLFNYTKVMMSQTITEFDDSFIAPVYNFTDCWDYYQQTSSIHYIDQVKVPTLILNAKDDPFFNNTIWPIHYSILENESGGGTVPIKMIQTENGGHLGYYFHQVNDEKYDEIYKTNIDNNIDPPNQYRHPDIIPSWSAVETGRFLAYAHHYDYDDNDSDNV